MNYLQIQPTFGYEKVNKTHTSNRASFPRYMYIGIYTYTYITVLKSEVNSHCVSGKYFPRTFKAE